MFSFFFFQTSLYVGIGQYTVNRSTSINISPDNFLKTLSCFEDCLDWQVLTFNASQGLRVEIKFHAFFLNNPNEYLEIGDGLTQNEKSRLVRFNGSTKPSDVISVSNAAWIKLKTPCDRLDISLTLTVSGVIYAGKLNYASIS